MKIFLRLTFAILIGIVAAGCPDASENKPQGNLSQPSPPPPPPPPPPPSGVGNQGVADDDSEPVEQVDPVKFAAEQKAADELEKMSFLVIREKPEKEVTSVHFMGNHRKIDKKIVDSLADLNHIGTINFSDTELSDDLLGSLTSNQSLVCLLLNGTHVGDKGLDYIARLEKLNALYLVDTKVTDAGLSRLAALPKLAILDLSGTKITDAGLQEIAKCQSLDWLLLMRTDITDEGLKSLANMPKLTRLTLFNTKITDAGVAPLKASKPNLRVDIGDRADLKSQ